MGLKDNSQRDERCRNFFKNCSGYDNNHVENRINNNPEVRIPQKLGNCTKALNISETLREYDGTFYLQDCPRQTLRK